MKFNCIMKIKSIMKFKSQIKFKYESGFTLIEVLLSLGILSSISIFAITTLASQLDMRNKLASINDSQHALNVAMEKVFDDVRHAYVLSKQDLVFSGMSGRATKPSFVARSGNFYFSMQNFRSFVGNSPQSNIAFVRYVEKPDAKNSGHKQLLRIVDTDMKESIERDGVGQEQVLVTDLAEFKTSYWNGVDFTQEWDTNSSDTEGKLPKMVKIKISAFNPLTDAEKQMKELNPTSLREASTISLESISYLLYSAGQANLKEPSKEYRWQ